ncbi:hypothetical protein RI367_008375 [Sorochytrium milnesiophthora]
MLRASSRPFASVFARPILYPHQRTCRRTMSEIQSVLTDKAPSAIGPYSQAIVANGMVFCSGQIPFVPSTMTVVEGGILEQTRQCLENMKAVLTAANSSLDRVVKTTVFLKDMNDFNEVNHVYSTYFDKHRPARSAVEVARLPRDVRVEVECIALVQ